MDLFSISQLEQFSGIRAHTIRIWEKRYNALQPARSQGNTRHYDNSQLQRLLNIVSLMEAGCRVSELAVMSDRELFKLLGLQLSSNPLDGSDDYFIGQLIAAGMAYDEPYFEKMFSNCLLRLGVEETYLRIIYPMLVRIGLMWGADLLPSAHEHFISNMLRQKLLAAIDSLPPSKPGKETWLLFLPESELHEIGLLMAQYVIRKAGKKVVYLGSNVAYDALAEAIKATDASHLMLFLVHYDIPAQIQQYLNTIKKDFKNAEIYVSGNKDLISELKLAKNIKWLKSLNELQLTTKSLRNV